MAPTSEPELPVVLPRHGHSATPLSAELLKELRCPLTGSALLQQGNELVTARAGAKGKAVRYAIVDSIPDLVAPIEG